MKRYLSLIPLMALLLASCSQSEELPGINDKAQEVTFSLAADTETQAQTRAATASLRYVMAIYKETDPASPIHKETYTGSTISVRLDAGKYTCLFWADYGEANYDATDLTAVTALTNTADDANAEAFYARQDITVTDGGLVNVVLRRAVAQVILRETANLESGKLTISYTACQQFNAGTGTASREASVTKSLAITSVIRGSADAPTEVCSLSFLASSNENLLGSFKVRYDDEAEKTISNIPVQANCKTNVNGRFGGTPYISFSAASEQTFAMNFQPEVQTQAFTLGDGEYFEYSIGGGSWTRFTSTVSNIPFGGTLGDLRLRGKSSKGTSANFGISGQQQKRFCNISFGTEGVMVDGIGDIRTLVDHENHETASTAEARFLRLFEFNSLLLTAPELPATTLADNCYSDMFSYCTSLTTAPELPATTLAKGCYAGMFLGCTSLTTAPELPASTLASGCYESMFYGCTSLTTAPELPASTLASSCYYEMFWGCTNLSEVKMLATDVSALRCIHNWLDDSGTSAATRHLTLASQDVYNRMRAGLPTNWRQGYAGTTVTFAN